MTELGIKMSGSPVESLLALAQHVETLDNFDADDVAANVVGDRWDGFDTPFDQIAFGIRARRYLYEQIGEELTHRLIKIPLTAIRSLHHFENAATDFLRTVSSLLDHSDARSVATTLAALSEETSLMRGVLDADPESTLSGVNVSLGRLAEYGRLKLHQQDARKIFESCPLRQIALDVSGTASGIDEAVAALEWLDVVRRSLLISSSAISYSRN